MTAPRRSRYFEDVNGKPLAAAARQRGRSAAEGIHSVLRKQLYPNEGPPKYSGINMWRGVTRWKPFLSGASMIRIGWHHPAKLLIYPIRNNIDAEGRQLVNWVCDIETPQYQARDWNRRGQPGRLPARDGGLAFRLARRAGIHHAHPTQFWNIRWSIRIRCRAGVSAA